MNNSLRISCSKFYGSLFRMSVRYTSESGGSGKSGSIREAGGSFAKREAAQEDEYFYRKQKEQLAQLRENLSDEIKFHEEQIERHKEAIERNKKKVEDMNKEK